MTWKTQARFDQEHEGLRDYQRLKWLPSLCATLLIAIAAPALAQNAPDAPSTPQISENAEQVAKILGVSQLASDARRMHSQVPCGAAATVEELSARQDISETLLAAAFEVDGVLAELDNERAHLAELSSILQARRDRGVNLTNVANIVTGTGVGIAVNALQFSNSTANFGNGLGVGSGIASTVLSIVGIRLQRGPQRNVGRIPNMLAPLFARPAVLNSYYPVEVLEYLRSVPPGEASAAGSRFDQLMAEWRQAGRIGAPGSAKTDQQITRLTSSFEDKTKVSIDDISDRMAMLGDVTGRVALMKRDLAELLRSVRSARKCAPSAQQPDAHRHNLNAAQQNDWSELNASMEKMHTAMASVERSGDGDVDFVRLMLPHHQAAIDMARTQLLYGKDPQMRSLAQEIITDQQSEIELMQLWVKQHGPQK